MRYLVFLVLAFLAGLGAMFLLQPSKGPQAIRKKAGIREHAFIFAYGDIRSGSVKAFLNTTSDFLIEHQFPLPFVFSSSVEPRQFPYPGIRWEPGINLDKDQNNSFLLIMGDRVEANGSLLADPAKLKDLVVEHFLPEQRHFLADLIPAPAPVEASILAPLWRASDRHQLMMFYENICIVCESGKRLAQLEKIGTQFPFLDVRVVSISPYSGEQIKRFREDHDLDIAIETVDEDFRQVWSAVDGGQAHHPLQGALVLVDPRGEILWTQRELQDCVRSLERMPLSQTLQGGTL